MKRSEVLNIITEIVSEVTYEKLAEERAERILSALEKAGIAPPEALIPVEDPYEILAPGCFQNTYGEFCWIERKWESEAE